ncbi:NCA2-domain-containing protein [Gyrodon lividus]|nr:NCA2-domain-containing protein [Gyrodon lividus]
MSLGYSAHYTEPLLPLANLQPPHLTGLDPRAEELYREFDTILKPPFSAEGIPNALELLQDDVFLHPSSSIQAQHASGVLLETALGRIAFGLYAKALDLYLDEASAAQDDAEWWAEVEQSNHLAALYLLQTLPKRLLNVLQVLRSHDGSLHLSTFHPSSLHVLFSTRSRLQPSTFMVTLFPHLVANPSLTLTRLPSGGVFYGNARRPAFNIVDTLRNSIWRFVGGFTSAIYFPLHLSRDECRLKRQDHEKIRDDRAEVLGKLMGMRPGLMQALRVKNGGSSAESVPNPSFLLDFVTALGTATSVQLSEQNVLSNFMELYKAIFITRKEEHASYLEAHDLRRPSRLTLMWPRLLLLPPLTLYCVKTLYASRATLTDLAQDTLETAHNLVTDWLLEPLRGIFKTIRTGGEEGVIVRREAVSADLDSLERMTLALAQEKLGYDQTQLVALSQQIRLGDLTPILQIYEQDIKRPFKSAVAGTLLRSLFVQVQKAKVDIDQALTGIDRLLKSQELTFAFIGVAPALAIVYVVGGFLRGLVFGGRARHGGKHRKLSVWLAMRRIERLLLFQPKSSHKHADQQHDKQPDSIPSLTSGLLVLSLTHLRNYALTSLPSRSRLREGFLEDVQDLEDPSLGRWEKLRVLDRMWNSWGRELEWYDIAGGR